MFCIPLRIYLYLHVKFSKRISEGKVQKKKRKKKLTNIIFALTHTCTLEKTKKNHFVLQATMENFEKGLKAGDASASKSVHCKT